MSDPIKTKDWSAAWWLAQQEANRLRAELAITTERLAVAHSQLALRETELAELKAEKRERERRIHDNPDALHERLQAGTLRRPEEFFTQGGWAER